MLLKSTIQLLRFHFSFFLLPVYLFALSQVPSIHAAHAILVFFILHLLVYPSSNGYNSYMDRDTTPIGGLYNPMQPTIQLFNVTVAMDVIAIALSFVISVYFAIGITLYILASRAYSNRSIRLKKYPVIGYLTVVIFQGSVVFFLSYHGSSIDKPLTVPLIPMIASACLIGGYYPLTQVYQHKEDEGDGVRTISMMLGINGTFIFTGLVFLLATILMFITFYRQNALESFYIFLVCMLPVVWFFSAWFRDVWLDERHADFRNSFRMNMLASICTAICFSILTITNHT